MNSTTTDQTLTPKAGTREWLGLALLMLPTVLLALDFSVLHLALPHLAADLQASSIQQLWIMDIYGFMIAGFLVTMGTLGDRIGRKKLLLIGASAFGLFSVTAAYATSAEMLIICRALLGISGATLMPSTLSLLHQMFQDPKQRTLAIGLWMMCFSGGGVMGPAIGGILLEHFWWGSVFLLGVPIMALLLIAAPALLPEYRDPQGGRMDIVSVLLSLAALLPIIYGIKELAKTGWSYVSILSIIIGLFVGWVFVKRQTVLSVPLLDMQLFRHKAFSGALSMMLLGGIIQGGYVFLFAQYLQLVVGLSPFEAGLWIIPLSVGSIIGSILAPFLVRLISPIHVIAMGLLVSAIASSMMIFVQHDTSMTLPIISSVLLTLGFSPLFVLTTDLIISSAPAEKSSSAASLSETSGELGMALGVAIVGSVAVAIYRHQVDIPEAIPPEYAEPAQDTLAGAVSVIEHMPEELALDMLHLAQSSFITGFNVIGGISAATLIALAGVSTVLVRKKSTAEQSSA